MNKKMTFENAMKRLEEIVQELESGDLSLDESLKKFEEGVKLSRLCSSKLDEAEKKVALLLKDQNGNWTEASFPDKGENS